MSTEVSRPTLSDALTERMLELIREGGLRPGDRLPSTRELSQRFAVTTPTLREALRRLEATGAIEMRHGSGIYVGAAIERLVLPNPNMREMHGGQLLELLGARIVIEPPLAAMAAGNATKEGLAELREVLAEAGRHLRGEDAELHETNMTFTGRPRGWPETACCTRSSTRCSSCTPPSSGRSCGSSTTGAGTTTSTWRSSKRSRRVTPMPPSGS